MACTLSRGRLEPCKDVTGGIKKVYFIDYTSGLEASATFDTDDQITGFDSALTLYEYEVIGNTDTFTETGTTSRDNGTTFYDVSGTVNLRAQTLADRKELQLMGAARPHIITLDYNGNYKFYGLENGCDVAVTAESGAAMGDFFGYTLNITAQEPALANFVSAAIIDDTTNTSVTSGT
jgi:hypothetical protein